MAARRLLIAGHSHMTALVGPSSSPKPEVHDVPGAADVACLAGPWPRGPDYWHAVWAEAKSSNTAILFGGNEHNHFFLVAAERPFDFVSSSAPEDGVAAGAEIIPEAMIRAKYAGSIALLDTHVPQAPWCKAGSVALVGTPPPKPHGSSRPDFIDEPTFTARAAELGQDVSTLQIAPYRLRFKLWRLLQDCYAERAAELGCRFIPVPDEVYTPEEGLGPAYWGTDVSHANGAYGAVMLQRVRQAFAA